MGGERLTSEGEEDSPFSGRIAEIFPFPVRLAALATHGATESALKQVDNVGFVPRSIVPELKLDLGHHSVLLLKPHEAGRLIDLYPLARPMNPCVIRFFSKCTQRHGDQSDKNIITAAI